MNHLQEEYEEYEEEEEAEEKLSVGEAMQMAGIPAFTKVFLESERDLRDFDRTERLGDFHHWAREDDGIVGYHLTCEEIQEVNILRHTKIDKKSYKKKRWLNGF